MTGSTQVSAIVRSIRELGGQLNLGTVIAGVPSSLDVRLQSGSVPDFLNSVLEVKMRAP